MISIIVSGHGEFASALKKTMEYVVGPQENIYFIDFNHGMGNHELEDKMREIIATIGKENEILFLTDISGGTPFSTAVLLSQELESSKIFGGTNMPMLFASLELREEDNLENISLDILEEARNNLVLFNSVETANGNNMDIEEDGI